MSTSNDREDMLERMERVADEENLGEEDDSFDADAVTGDSMGLEETASSYFGSSGYVREESMGTEGSFTLDDEEDQWIEPRRQGSLDDSHDSDGERPPTSPTQRRGSHSSRKSLDSQGSEDRPPLPNRERRESWRRSSFVSTDRSSANSYSSRDSPVDQQGSPVDESQPGHTRQRRRHSVKLQSIYSSKSSNSSTDEVSELHHGSIMKGIRQPFNRFSTLRPMVSRRRSNEGSAGPLYGGSGNDISAKSAFTNLGTIGNSQLDDVAVAAAVVALGSTAVSSHRGYAVDDTVLVFLNMLNHTNDVDPPDAFTVNPVNKYGFPPGEGKSQDEQQGPFVYILATVKRVHFNEDVPYYTVIRGDTLAEQRADSAWMEPLAAMDGIEAATRAAHQTGRSVENEPETKEGGGFLFLLAACLAWPFKFARLTVAPWYRLARAVAKEQVSHALYGDAPFYCYFRATGINLLVMCSIIYLFIEEVALAFFPAKWDFGVAVVGVAVWGVLVVELIIEWLIRPDNYGQLVNSDKAYAPSTARHINSFHMIFEAIALLLFIPQFDCLLTKECGKRILFSGVDSALNAVLGPTKAKSVFGRFVIGLSALRIFGLIRHWKNMWINRTYIDDRGKKTLFFGRREQVLFHEDESTRRIRNRSMEDEERRDDVPGSKPSTNEDQRLKKAATVGTALMVVNSQRALLLIVIIVTVVPMILSLLGVNTVSLEMVDILEANNLVFSNANSSSCGFLKKTVNVWLDVGSTVNILVSHYDEKTWVLWAQLLPVRCDWQRADGVITVCEAGNSIDPTTCKLWNETTPDDPDDATPEYYADALGIRVGGITWYEQTRQANNDTFSVRALVNENHVIGFTNTSEFALLVIILFCTLCGLAVLRLDAGRLVLGPLQRMLKIVVRYSENPLASTPQAKKRKHKSGDESNEDDADKDDDVELGNYETEQLISAITKIADLLRKCWGVAGASIISTNLARTQDGLTVGFNPTVPGKQVYALFAFVAIDHFSDQLLDLDRDVMILINDVAKVVHDEVYRWALGDSGQCNKNLGGAFLMVFRIGDFKEVEEKKTRATNVVFSSEMKANKANTTKTLRRRGRAVGHSGQRVGGGQLTRNRRGRHLDPGESLTLASLPGIQAFTDRALIGLLKSFAGISRDRRIQDWKKDFRLGAGVGAFAVNIMIGMDAGWAVEGAVGSEYKIDATYLSPHVNMASRMMSATKQYGVALLLSQAVEELLSIPAREKLRHVDTVFVKGSSVAQRVFTYDARNQGVDFFLLERTPEQADLDAESYAPTIWDTDQDLLAMRQHVTQEFQEKFKEGVKSYLAGHWKEAISALEEADGIMITTVLEEGYIDYNPDEAMDGRLLDRRSTDDEVVRVRNEYGDGACKCLINYMERRGAVPPKTWGGVRPLTSK